MRVAILGASAKVQRYSHMALVALLRHGHEPVPVHPGLAEVEGLAVVKDLSQIQGEIDAVTVYVNSQAAAAAIPEIIATGAKLVVFNPGTECPEMYAHLEESGVRVIEGCTLVMLSTGTWPNV